MINPGKLTVEQCRRFAEVKADVTSAMNKLSAIWDETDPELPAEAYGPLYRPLEAVKGQLAQVPEVRK